jgi:Fe-S cluster assembly iron-binding protein IscA
LEAKVTLIEVTNRAKELLEDILLKSVYNPELTLRMVVQPEGRLRLVPDRSKKTDQVVEKDGRAILLVGQELAPILDHLTLDIKETDHGSKFFMS